MTAAVDGVDEGAWRASVGKQRSLNAVATTTAVVGVGVFAAVARRGDVEVSALLLAAAALAFAASQFARITVRLGTDRVLVAWGEVGIFASLCLVPSLWLPVSTAAGAAAAHCVRLVRAGPDRRQRVWYATTSVVAGGVAAAAVAVPLTDPTRPVVVDLNTPSSLLPPLGAALAYFLATSLLTAGWVSVATGESMPRVWVCGVRATRLVHAGHLATGLAVVAGLGVRWLILFAPIMWLVHQAYTHQLRGAEENAAWQALDSATRSLSQDSERAVVAAAQRGCAELFGCDEVEVVVFAQQGNRRSYRADARHLVPVNQATVGRAGRPALVGPVSEVESRRLIVGGFDVGELRLWYRAKPRMSASTRHAFSAFADAVASALHDAMTHRQLTAMAQRSAHSAVHDTLTGLSNRTALLMRGQAALEQVPPDSPIAVILLGLDGLREINETLGRSAGDGLLQALARRLADQVLAGEVIGRLGGDEFVVLITGEDRARGDLTAWLYPAQRAHAIAAAFAAPLQVAGVTIAAETSAGVVIDVAAGCDLTELLRRADVALRQAKQEATKVVVYRAASDVASPQRLALLADLRDALAGGDQIGIELLPTVDLTSTMPISVQACKRWLHPVRGVLAPAEYTEIIDDSDLATSFSQRTLELSLAIAAHWARAGITLPISVPLCRRCLYDPLLPKRVEHGLAAYQVPARQLIVEFTETAIAVEDDVVEPVIRGLKAAGVRLSLNDFGTSTASLSFLTRFPVDEVKIDRGFVAGMASSVQTTAIVRTTVDLARRLDMRVIAQGVERHEQAQALRELGVTAAQGPLFYPVMGVEEARRRIGEDLKKALSPRP